MLSIGVTSDTHIPAQSRGLPEAVTSAFSQVDLILHAGDLTCLEVVEELARLAPVHAVFGNMDDSGVRTALEARKVVEVEGCRIGLTHGAGPPIGLHASAVHAFRKDRVCAVVFGHSHRPFNKRVDDVLAFNPGSPTDRRFAPYRSFGRLFVEGNTVSGEIIKIGDGT